MASDFTKRYLAARRKKEEEGKLPSFSGTARRVEEAAPRSQSTRTEAPAKGQDDFTSRYLARKKELGLVTERNARFTPTLPDFRGRGLTGSTITDSAASSAQSAAKQSTSYLDTARNAGKTTIAATSTLGEDERKKRMDELTGEIEKLNSAIELQQSGISRASVYGGADAMRERLREDQERLKALQDEYTTLERSGEHTEADELRWQIEDAEKRKRELDNTIPAGEAGGRAAAYAWKNNPELQDEYIQQHGEFVEAKSAQESLEALEAAREYVAKVDEKSYEDDFGGQFGANYRLGRINQDMNDAFNRYLINPTEEIKEAAYTLWELANEFQTKYDTVLDDEGAILPWITQDAAGYVPQFVDQAKAELTGGAIGALGGALVGNPIAGFRAGAIAGSGVESYGQMRGAAFRAMIEAGADEEEARAAANDEALINALIEMGGTAISFASLGGTKALNVLADAATKSGSKAAPVLTKLLGKSAVDKAAGVAAKEAGKTAGRKVLYTIGGIGINALGEAAEEAAQQGVSIANRNREGEGIANLVKEASGTLWDAATGKDDAARDEIADAAWQGFKVALMFGGTQSVVNNVASNYLNAKSNKQRDAVVDAVMRDDEVLTALVEEGKASGENSVSAKIASEIESDLSNGKSVTREQVKSLIAANDVYIAEENRVAAQEEAKSAAEKLGYGEHGRATLASISETQELSTEEVNAEFHLPYLQGLSNMDVSETNFTSPLQREAFNAGKLDRIMNTKKDVENAKYAKVAANSGFDYASPNIPKQMSKATLDVYDDFSKALGNRTTFLEKIAVGNDESGANAVINGDGSIALSADTDIKKNASYFFHEGFHRMKQLAPSESRDFINAVVATQISPSSSVNPVESMQNFAARRGVNLTVEKAMEEIAADRAGEMFGKNPERARVILRDVMNEIESEAKKNGKTETEAKAHAKSVVQKFIDAIRSVIQSLKEYLSKNKSKMSEESKRDFNAVINDLTAEERLWKDALKASVKAVQEKSGEMKKSAVQESDAKYSQKSGQRITEASARAALYDALDHGDAAHDNLILLGDMPAYIKNLVGIEGDLYIYRNHAYENMVSKEKAIEDGRPGGKNSHFHNLGIDTMADAIMSLEHPSVTIADNMTDGNPAISMVLPVFGVNNAPLHAVISFYENTEINGKFDKRPHLAVTFYEHPYVNAEDSRHPGLYETLTNALRDSRVLDVSKKIREDQPVIAKDLPLSNIAKSSLEKNVARFKTEVKRFKEKNKISYSLKDVDPIEPTSNKWARGATFAEVKAAHPTLFELDADEAEVRNPTQIVGTVKSYRKIYDTLKEEKFNGSILDASSGLGYGTRAGIDEYGFRVDDIEPFPDASYEPKYTDYSTLDKTYDVIISNAVLNVIPQDLRDAMVVKIGEMLKPGGRAFINVRGTDVKNASSKIPIHEEQMEYFISSSGSYQKGFTKSELKAYLEDALGDGFTVENTNRYGAVAAIVTKDGQSAQFSMKDSEGATLTKEQREFFKDSKVRDENGNLMVMYHGSENAGFHEFNTRFSDDSTSFFFANSNTVAKSYSGTREVYAPKTLRTADDLNSFFEEIGASEYAAEERDGTFYLLDDGDEVAESDTASGIYEEFQDWTGIGHGSANYKVYLNITNPLIVDAERNNWNELPAADGKTKTTREYAKEAESKGHDGVIFHNIIDNGAYASGMEQYETSTVAIAFNAEQVKSTENKHPTDDPDIRFSMKDSAGRELSDGQREYFKDSKERDRDGNLRVMYNGGGGDFTVFDRKKSKYSNLYGRGFYFTNSESHAKQYGDARSFYLNIVNPVSTDERTITKKQLRKFLEAVAENEDDYSFENYGYGATVDSVLNSVYGEKSDFAMLYDVSQTAIGDMVAAVELFNEVNGTMYDGLILDTETVIFNSEQAKLTSNENPTSNPDVRFSMKKDRDYLAAVESGDMKTAQKMVDEAAKMVMPNSKIVNDDGTLKKVYHGSANQFNVFDYGRLGNTGHQEGFGFYFADTKTITKHYGESREFYLDMQRPMYSDKKTITLRELMKFMKALDPDGNGVISGYEDAGSVGYTTALRRAASTIMEFNDNDQDVIFEVANADGSNYTADEFIKFAKVLKETIGFDGLISAWPAGNVYVVFDNKQMKFADVVTRDDTGETIPLSDRFNKDTEDLRFSLKGQSSLLDENKKLREVNEALREQFKTTKFAQVDKKQLDAFAKKLLQDYESGADINETRDALNDLYVYMANGEDGQAPVWSEVQRRAYDAAVAILEEASTINDDLYQEYKSLRNRLRKYPISISKEYDGDLGGYESINEFRKANFGRIKLTNDGTPVDIVYNDLASTYPEFFDEYHYSTQADQLVHIAEVLDSLQPYEVNPYSYNMREAASWLADDIIERFYELPQAKPTFADKAEQKLTKQVIKDAKKLETLRDKKNERIAKLIEQSREKVRKTQQKERTKRAEAVAKVRDHYEAKEMRASDRRKASIWRKKIKKHVDTISKLLLKGNDNSHVPEEMREVVSEFLSVIDLTTPRQKEKTINRLNELRTLYKKIADNETEIETEVDPDLAGYIDDVTAALKQGGETVSVADLNNRELEALYRVLLAVERSIYMHNRAMADGKTAQISEIAQKVMIENSTGKAYQEHNRVVQWGADMVNMDMLNPQDYFIQLGGTMNDMFGSIRNGFDKKIRLLAEAKSYMEALLEDVDVKSLSDKKAVAQQFKTGNGQTISLTPAQVMSLYLLQRQKDALDHIYKGGIKPAPVVAREGKDKRAKVKRSYDVVKVTPDDVAKILKSMTPEQQKIADGISKFFTDYTAKWGNEVSLALYGYKKFTVENYFPIVSDQNYLKDVFGETTDATLKNMGSTKARIQGASNPIIIEDALDVFARQADQMSSYNAFVIPLSDIQRVFNFKTSNGSVKQSIEKRYGVRATQYFKKLMTDINGGGRWNGGSQLMNEMVSRYKQAKMGLNLRVVLQQPSAMLRAQAVIDGKYLAQAMATKSSVDLETIYKYAPVAQWKNWGFFSMDTGKQMKDVLLDSKQLSDYTMWAAGKMDEITWKRLWVASEMEVRDKQPDLARGSEEYLEAVGKRFSEIIDRTQVVDSVLHRSQIMRNPDALVKMSVAFMNEPFKAYNMVRTAAIQFKHNPTQATKQALWAAGVAYMTTLIVNHLITAAVDTWRGDEEDEEWLEKIFNKVFGKDEEEKEPKTLLERYLWHFADNAVNEPLSMFPFVKDVVSMVQGYDVKRMDMQGVGDFVNALTRGLSDKYTIAQKVIDIGSKFGDLLGIPVSSLKRELSSVVKVGIGAVGSPLLEYEADKVLYTVTGNKSRFMDILYKAYKAGDMEAYRKIAQDMIDEGITPSSIESGIKSRAKKDGVSVSDMNTVSFSAGVEAKYEVEKPVEDKFDINKLSGNQYTQFIEDRGQMLDEIISDFQRRGFGSLDEETANELLAAAYTFAEETALEDASSGLYESDTKWIDKAQNADDLGLTVSEYLMLRAEHDSDIGADGVYDAYEAGVDVDTYLDFKDALGDLEYAKGVNGARKEAIVDLLNSMGLTQDEWDYLFGTEYKTGSSGFGGSFGGGFGGSFGGKFGK